jgi:hypothetical protein
MLKNLLFVATLSLCFSTITLAQGSSSLKEVTHDNTLTGKGTTASPLGMADGAVTAPKLGTNNAPQTGQVLTFNGSGLSWQTPTASPVGGSLRIVNNNGAEVGIPISESKVVRYILSQDTWIAFSVTKAGITPELSPFSLLYESTDCTGTIYMSYDNRDAQQFAATTHRVGDNLYFASGTSQSKTINSRGLPAPNGTCQQESFETLVAPATIIPVSDFGTPPFKLSR